MTRRTHAWWLGGVAARRAFVGDAHRRYPTLRGQNVPGGFRYTLMVDVPQYDGSRAVKIQFDQDPVEVTVDGPTNSPHRFASGALCMWYPHDPPEMVWQIADGLGRLIACIEIHLFKESWWRESGEWLGPEAPHGVAS